MEIEVSGGPLEAVEAQTLAFAVAEPPTELPPAGRELDRLLNGRLARLAEAGDLRADPWSVCVVHPDGELRAERVAAAGLGRPEALDLDALRTAAAAVVRTESRV